MVGKHFFSEGTIQVDWSESNPLQMQHNSAFTKRNKFYNYQIAIEIVVLYYEVGNTYNAQS